MESDDSTSNDDQISDFVSSSQNKTNYSGIGCMNSSKTGRKGDPRMHCAVGARLANPKISLFEALQIGGFDYENDDDANAVDSEGITLAQRKNQLSRRIRFAQKSQGLSSNLIDCSGSTMANDCGRPKRPSKVNGKNEPKNGMQCSDLELKDNGLQLDRSVSGTISTSSESKKRSGCATDSYPLRARQHPDFHPLVVPLLQRCTSTHADTREPQLFHQQISQLGNIFSNRTSSHPNARGASNLTQQPSAVAITSLSQTAASVGMTLEQFALALRNSNNLSQILNNGRNCSSLQKQLALSLYHSEIRSLYQRAMLLSGYSSEVAQNEHSSAYLEFVMEAWKIEGERLSKIMIEHSHHELSKANKRGTNGRSGQVQSVTSRSRKDNETKRSRSKNETHHDHATDCSVQETSQAEDVEDRASGRHVHLLDGNCGHQPVLHQPSGGKPHIDFVVGDLVECYHDLQPSQALTWLSNDAVTTCETGESSVILEASGSSNNLVGIAPISGGEPKIYDRRDIDFDTDEWNFDFAASDSLLGLFKLGDTKQHTGCHHPNSGG